jgi:Nucleotidyltransferase
MENSYSTVLLQVLCDLRSSLDRMVIIGGWVPELHRRADERAQWAVEPLATIEIDILVVDSERNPDDSTSIAEHLVAAGFAPVGGQRASAVWERDISAGERIEFFLDHSASWGSLAAVRTIEAGTRLGGLPLEGLGVLRDHSVTLLLPIVGAESDDFPLSVRVPELAAFLVHKAATFRRRPDHVKMAKDLQYVVDVMASGEAQVGVVEAQIEAYCAEGGAIAEVARSARNLIQLVVGESPATELRRRLAASLSVRHGLSRDAADARGVGHLMDFVDLIPPDCGERSAER